MQRRSQQIYECPRSPQRIVLKPALHDGRQHTASFEERASTAHFQQCSETCCGEIDYRIQGLHHHTVKQEDHTRKEAVKKLLHQFETHPNREALKAKLRQNYPYNPFSEKSQDMIRSMGNVEFLEICEISPKLQCPHCLTYWTKSIVYCTCGTCLRPTDKTRKSDRDRFDALSIPNYVIKKDPSHRARHGHTERQRIYHAAHVAAKKKE